MKIEYLKNRGFWWWVRNTFIIALIIGVIIIGSDYFLHFTSTFKKEEVPVTGKSVENVKPPFAKEGAAIKNGIKNLFDCGAYKIAAEKKIDSLQQLLNVKNVATVDTVATVQSAPPQVQTTAVKSQLIKKKKKIRRSHGRSPGFCKCLS